MYLDWGFSYIHSIIQLCHQDGIKIETRAIYNTRSRISESIRN